jgi:hypothetical protein
MRSFVNKTEAIVGQQGRFRIPPQRPISDEMRKIVRGHGRDKAAARVSGAGNASLTIPIPLLPDGTQLKTLRAAISYLVRAIPKAERDMPEALTAAEVLTNASEREGAWVFFARAATLQAIHRNDIRVFNPDRNDHHWGRRKLKRDR